jgi:hypothetical protein
VIDVLLEDVLSALFDDADPHWSQQPGKRRPFVDTY